MIAGIEEAVPTRRAGANELVVQLASQGQFAQGSGAKSRRLLISTES
jgi:hypothetical protein